MKALFNVYSGNKLIHTETIDRGQKEDSKKDDGFLDISNDSDSKSAFFLTLEEENYISLEEIASELTRNPFKKQLETSEIFKDSDWSGF